VGEEQIMHKMEAERKTDKTETYGEEDSPRYDVYWYNFNYPKKTNERNVMVTQKT
jgi:hypothetical protein